MIRRSTPRPAAEALPVGVCVACKRSRRYVRPHRTSGFVLLLCANHVDCNAYRDQIGQP